MPKYIGSIGKLFFEIAPACIFQWIRGFTESSQKRDHQEILIMVYQNRGKVLSTTRYRNGHLGRIRNPKGVLVREAWKRHPDAKGNEYLHASIFGYGSTAGSAFVQGKAQAGCSKTRMVNEYSIFYFYNLERMESASFYKPEKYVLEIKTKLLKRQYL